ncbi:MAG: hypothetical protein IJA27_07320, partial [Lachnospiraceae bacterium]|nr:hypothetical protein [Lachnospiraceae bacterium]
SQSPVPAGLIKVPLFLRIAFLRVQKFGSLVLWEVIFIFKLQYAETQVQMLSNTPLAIPFAIFSACL